MSDDSGYEITKENVHLVLAAVSLIKFGHSLGFGCTPFLVNCARAGCMKAAHSFKSHSDALNNTVSSLVKNELSIFICILTKTLNSVSYYHLYLSVSCDIE